MPEASDSKVNEDHNLNRINCEVMLKKSYQRTFKTILALKEFYLTRLIKKAPIAI